jgi:hypothetical protein
MPERMLDPVWDEPQGSGGSPCLHSVMTHLFDKHIFGRHTQQLSIIPHISPSIASPNASHHGSGSIASLKHLPAE